MDLHNDEKSESKQMETCRVMKISEENSKVPSRKELKRLQVRAFIFDERLKNCIDLAKFSDFMYHNFCMCGLHCDTI